MAHSLMQLLTLETPRLRLRPFREEDLDALTALYADAEVMRFIGDGKTLDRAATWRQIALFLGHQQLRGYSTLAIEDRASGEFLGECGPWYPEGWPMLEVGWLVAPQRQGQGVATEAGRAVLDWCFEHLPTEPICSLIRPDNQSSARVAQKLGAHLERSLDDYFGGPTDMWMHRRPG
jgi:RimJ/RimL family protein N-acetyltransferase